MRSALPCLSCQGIYGGTNNCEIIYIWHYLHHAMNTIQCTRWRRCAETIEYPFVPRLADNWSDLVFNKIINYQYGVKLIRYYVGKYPNSWDDFAKHEPIPNTYSFRRNARNIRFPILFFFFAPESGNDSVDRLNLKRIWTSWATSASQQSCMNIEYIPWKFAQDEVKVFRKERKLWAAPPLLAKILFEIWRDWSKSLHQIVFWDVAVSFIVWLVSFTLSAAPLASMRCKKRNTRVNLTKYFYGKLAITCAPTSNIQDWTPFVVNRDMWSACVARATSSCITSTSSSRYAMYNIHVCHYGDQI